MDRIAPAPTGWKSTQTSLWDHLLADASTHRIGVDDVQPLNIADLENAAADFLSAQDVPWAASRVLKQMSNLLLVSHRNASSAANTTEPFSPSCLPSCSPIHFHVAKQAHISDPVDSVCVEILNLMTQDSSDATAQDNYEKNEEPSQSILHRAWKLTAGAVGATLASVNRFWPSVDDSDDQIEGLLSSVREGRQQDYDEICFNGSQAAVSQQRAREEEAGKQAQDEARLAEEKRTAKAKLKSSEKAEEMTLEKWQAREEASQKWHARQAQTLSRRFPDIRTVVAPFWMPQGQTAPYLRQSGVRARYDDFEDWEDDY